MTGKEAYKKICDLFGYEPIVKGCREYDRYYGFFLSPPGVKKEEPVFVGAMIVVDKNTGRVISDDADETVSLSGQRWKPVKLDEEDEEIEHSAELFDALTSSYLMHDGQAGQEWYKHVDERKWQTHAVYAHGMPNPYTLDKEMATKTTAQLREAKNRLDAETDLKYSIMKNQKVNDEYRQYLTKGGRDALKKFKGMVDGFRKSDIGKLAGNAIKYKAYTETKKKFDKETADALFRGIINNDGNGGGGGKKNKKNKNWN